MHFVKLYIDSKIFFFIVFLLLSLSYGYSQKSFKSFKSSDFHTFFNIKETNRKITSDTSIRIEFKTGQNKEFVNLSVTIDKDSNIIKSIINIDRAIINGINTQFTKDLIKNFMFEFSCDFDFIMPLCEKIYYYGNEKKYININPTLTNFYEVFTGEKVGFVLAHNNCITRFNNLRRDGGNLLLVIEFSLKKNK